jgi:hypothetical protein
VRSSKLNIVGVLVSSAAVGGVLVLSVVRTVGAAASLPTSGSLHENNAHVRRREGTRYQRLVDSVSRGTLVGPG